MEEGRSAFKILTGKPTGKRSLGWPRLSWADNIRLDIVRKECVIYIIETLITMQQHQVYFIKT